MKPIRVGAARGKVFVVKDVRGSVRRSTDG